MNLCTVWLETDTSHVQLLYAQQNTSWPGGIHSCRNPRHASSVQTFDRTKVAYNLESAIHKHFSQFVAPF